MNLVKREREDDLEVEISELFKPRFQPSKHHLQSFPKLHGQESMQVT